MISKFHQFMKKMVAWNGRKTFRSILLGFIIQLIPVFLYGQEQNSIALFGHAYGSLKTDSSRSIFADILANSNTELVFSLGDCDLWDSEIYNQYKNKIGSAFYSIPGNQDLADWKRELFLSNSGTFNRLILNNYANIICINSSESAQKINSYLNSVVDSTNKSLPTVLLTHHRIWDDQLIDDAPFSHDKCFFFDEIKASIIALNVEYIFAGNSPGEYFRRQKSNNINYWCDVTGGIKCYSIGMPYDSSKVSYVIISFSSSGLNIKPIQVSLNETKNTRNKNQRNHHTEFRMVKLTSLVTNKRYLLGMISGILIALGMLLLVKIAKSYNS